MDQRIDQLRTLWYRMDVHRDEWEASGCWWCWRW